MTHIICNNHSCNKLFQFRPGTRGKFCSLSCSTVVKNATTKQHNIDQYMLNPATCQHCTKPLPYDKRRSKFCDHHCSATSTNYARAQSGWINPKKKDKPKTTKVNPPKEVKLRKPRAKVDPDLLYKECAECNQKFKLKYLSSNRKYCSPICFGKNRGGYRSIAQITKKIHQYNGLTFDSGAEVYFAKLCETYSLKYIRNSGQYFFPYTDQNGKQRNYYPDFLLSDFNVFVEIKGKRFLNESTYTKLKSVDRPIYLVMSDKVVEFFESRLWESNPL